MVQPDLCSPLAGRSGRQEVGLRVVLAAHMRNAEDKRAGEFSADPMQRIQARTSTAVLPRHLPHDHFGIGINMDCLGLQGDGTLQGFQEGEILGDVVILAADPLGDSDLAAMRIVDDYPNTGRSGIAQRPAIDVSHQIRHWYVTKMLKKKDLVKPLSWFHREKRCGELIKDCESNVEKAG